MCVRHLRMYDYGDHLEDHDDIVIAAYHVVSFSYHGSSHSTAGFAPNPKVQFLHLWVVKLYSCRQFVQHCPTKTSLAPI